MQNYLYIILWIIYFVFYFFFKSTIYLNSYVDLTKHFNLYLPYFNSFIAVFTIIWVIWLLDKYLEDVLTVKKKNVNLKYTIIFNVFLIKFLHISKYLIAVYLWIQFINFPLDIADYINKAFKVSFIIALLFLSNWLISSIFIWMTSRKKWDDLSKQIFPLLWRILGVFIWIIGILTILWNIWYNISALITWAWVWGIAIALAAQKSIANIFWALSIMLNKPFKVWEMVKINSYTWSVKEIWLTYLELTDPTWNKILIPNEALISSVIENLTQRENRKTDFIIWIVYSTDLIKLKKSIKMIEDILEFYLKKWSLSSYRVHFDNFWSFSLDIKVTYFSLENDSFTLYAKQKEEINLEIKKQFDEEGIEFAFPTQEVIIKN